MHIYIYIDAYIKCDGFFDMPFLGWKLTVKELIEATFYINLGFHSDNRQAKVFRESWDTANTTRMVGGNEREEKN